MYNRGVRTTIEMKPEHRAKLLEIAARRGEKGFSAVVADAIDVYLRGNPRQEDIRKRAIRAGGSLSRTEAGHLRRTTTRLREHWR